MDGILHLCRNISKNVQMFWPYNRFISSLTSYQAKQILHYKKCNYGEMCIARRQGIVTSNEENNTGKFANTDIVFEEKNSCEETLTENAGFKQQLHQEERIERKIGLSREEQLNLLKLKPHQPKDPHVLRVAVIGAPNAGKSTLANQLLNWKYSAVSSKVHTTRHKSIGVLTEKNTQLIFLDTPGMITPEKRKRHSLDMSLLSDPHSSLHSADTILVVVDVSDSWHRRRLDNEVLKALHIHRNKQIVLVLNKVDKYNRPEDLLHTTRILTEGVIASKTGWYKKKNQGKKEKQIKDLNAFFNSIDNRQNNTTLQKTTNTLIRSNNNICEISQSSNLVPDKESQNQMEDAEKLKHKNWTDYYCQVQKCNHEVKNKNGFDNFGKVFHVSALDNVGLQDIKTFLIESAKPGDWEYDESVITDMDPTELAQMCVWEKLLDYLPAEIPYRIQIKVAFFKVDEDGVLRTIFYLLCQRKRDYSALLKDPKIIQKIAAEAKQELMNTFRSEVTLQLVAKSLYKRQ